MYTLHPASEMASPDAQTALSPHTIQVVTSSILEDIASSATMARPLCPSPPHTAFHFRSGPVELDSVAATVGAANSSGSFPAFSRSESSKDDSRGPLTPEGAGTDVQHTLDGQQQQEGAKAADFAWREEGEEGTLTGLSRGVSQFREVRSGPVTPSSSPQPHVGLQGRHFAESKSPPSSELRDTKAALNADGRSAMDSDSSLSDTSEDQELSKTMVQEIYCSDTTSPAEGQSTSTPVPLDIVSLPEVAGSSTSGSTSFGKGIEQAEKGTTPAEEAFVKAKQSKERTQTKSSKGKPRATDFIGESLLADSRRKARSAGQTLSDSKGAGLFDSLRFEMEGRHYEYQVYNCQNKRYREWYKCRHCTEKQSGDTCRFINLRIFPLRDVEGVLSPGHPDDQDASGHAPFFADELPRQISFKYPKDAALYPSASSSTTSAIKLTVANSLLATMRLELQHASLPDTLWRNPELLIRPQCDFCLTSIFSASYCCRCCGREYCLECTRKMRETEARAVKTNGREVQSLFKCKWKRDHRSQELVPLTRFRVEELQDEVREMEETLSASTNVKDTLTSEGSSSSEDSLPLGQSTEPSVGGQAQAQVPLPVSVEEGTSAWYESLDGPTVDAAIGSHVLTEFDAGLEEMAFQDAWARGEPIIVHKCLPTGGDDEVPRKRCKSESDPEPTSEAPQTAWGPWSFCNPPWQKQRCFITRCDADNAFKEVTVYDFFSTFGQTLDEKVAKLGSGIWKLKDWPPSSAFDDAFPDLYEHFNAALPVPAYTRRDGRMNISALFPSNANAPDLGPKMYNAWPSSEDQIGAGSTRLHMDVADAVNIMYYAAKPPNPDELPEAHRDGVAAWDIFPASDSQKIREYLRETRNMQDYEDPIHSQKYFLDAGDRQRLWDRKGVKSWRIYQKTGDAIFIPAGCAHQVCNLTDCMKIAVDFVSPQNVARCFQLTAEFRALSNNKILSWKEDVLQLKSMLWHAWRACREMEGHRYDAGSSADTQQGKVKPPARYSKPFMDFRTITKVPSKKRSKTAERQQKEKKATRKRQYVTDDETEESLRIETNHAGDESMIDTAEAEHKLLRGEKSAASIGTSKKRLSPRENAETRPKGKAQVTKNVSRQKSLELGSPAASSTPALPTTSKTRTYASKRPIGTDSDAASDAENAEEEFDGSSVGPSKTRPRHDGAAKRRRWTRSDKFLDEDEVEEGEEGEGHEGWWGENVARSVQPVAPADDSDEDWREDSPVVPKATKSKSKAAQRKPTKKGPRKAKRVAAANGSRTDSDEEFVPPSAPREKSAAKAKTSQRARGGKKLAVACSSLSEAEAEAADDVDGVPKDEDEDEDVGLLASLPTLDTLTSFSNTRLVSLLAQVEAGRLRAGQRVEDAESALRLQRERLRRWEEYGERLRQRQG